MNEKEAVKKAKRGDSAAFEQLVQMYEKKVYATAYRFAGNEHDALDISQEVFIRVYRFIGKFNEESSFSTWLYRITVNACKDLVKKRGGRMEVPLEAPDEESGGYFSTIADERYDPVSAYEKNELAESIQSCIEALPDNYRQIITMRDVYGLTYEEISDALSLEIGTVKSRISRARERVRTILLQSGNKSQSLRSKE